MVGPNHDNDLCVVRFGGHRENEETVIECLKREIKEEASIIVTPISSPITYYTESWDKEPILVDQDFKKTWSTFMFLINVK